MSGLVALFSMRFFHFVVVFFYVLSKQESAESCGQSTSMA